MSEDGQMGSNWSDEDWEYLLEDIQKGAVIPVLGEELYTVAGTGGAGQPLYPLMAQKLAAQLKLEMPPVPGQSRPLHEVMCAYLKAMERSGKKPEMDRVCDRFCELFETLNPPPSEALKQIALIRDFRLLVTTTPDKLLERAIDEVRFEGRKGTTSLAFTLKPPFEDLRLEYDPTHATPNEPPTVYHLFGRLVKRLPDQFVLSDDDLLEFFRAIQSLPREQLPYLRAALEDNHLLFLGGSLSDWLVRFLLRIANGENRLGKRDYYDVLVVPDAAKESDLVKFLKFFSPRTKLALYNPSNFVAELHRRWLKANPIVEVTEGPPIIPPEDKMPQESVFISYASEDREMVYKFKAFLDKEGIPAWFDRHQLEIGQHWDMEIQKNLDHCLFFIPIISQATQKILLNAYFRKEWNLADQIALKSDAGVEFILPVLLESISGKDLAVPPSFKQKQSIVAPQGVPSPEFVKRLKRLVDERKLNPLRRQS